MPHPSQHPKSQCTSSHNEHSASKADSSLLSPLRKSNDASTPTTASAGLKHRVRRDRRNSCREAKPMVSRGVNCFLQNCHQVRCERRNLVFDLVEMGFQLWRHRGNRNLASSTGCAKGRKQRWGINLQAMNRYFAMILWWCNPQC
jgi:hypothetical protein